MNASPRQGVVGRYSTEVCSWIWGVSDNWVLQRTHQCWCKLPTSVHIFTLCSPSFQISATYQVNLKDTQLAYFSGGQAINVTVYPLRVTGSDWRPPDSLRGTAASREHATVCRNALDGSLHWL